MANLLWWDDAIYAAYQGDPQASAPWDITEAEVAALFEEIIPLDWSLPTPEDAAWWASQNAYGDELGDGERYLSCVAMPADIYDIEAIRAAEADRLDNLGPVG